MKYIIEAGNIFEDIHPIVIKEYPINYTEKSTVKKEYYDLIFQQYGKQGLKYCHISEFIGSNFNRTYHYSPDCIKKQTIYKQYNDMPFKFKKLIHINNRGQRECYEMNYKPYEHDGFIKEIIKYYARKEFKYCNKLFNKWLSKQKEIKDFEVMIIGDYIREEAVGRYVRQEALKITKFSSL